MADATMTVDLRPSRFWLVLRYIRRNKSLAIGLVILFFLIAFTAIGFMVINPKHAYPLSAAARKAPSWAYPFGTDFFGRDLFAAMVVGMWQTAAIGLLAGGLGTMIGVVLGFISAYFGGWIDTIIKTVCQILTPIPVLLIQVVVAGSLDKRDVTILMMALIIVMLGWMGTTLVVRAQVLTMKERQFVSVAKLSGMGPWASSSRRSCPTCCPSSPPPLWCRCSRRCLPRSISRCWALARCASRCWATSSGRPGAGRVLQRLVVVADRACRGDDPDSGSLALINMGLDELANPRVRRTE